MDSAVPNCPGSALTVGMIRKNTTYDSCFIKNGMSMPGEKTPKTERGRRTLRKILDAAELEFGARGFHEESVASITATIDRGLRPEGRRP